MQNYFTLPYIRYVQISFSTRWKCNSKWLYPKVFFLFPKFLIPLRPSSSSARSTIWSFSLMIIELRRRLFSTTTWLKFIRTHQSICQWPPDKKKIQDRDVLTKKQLWLRHSRRRPPLMNAEQVCTVGHFALKKCRKYFWYLDLQILFKIDSSWVFKHSTLKKI